MSPFWQVLGLVTFGSMLSLVVALALVGRKDLLSRLNLYLVAFASGTLVGTALFDLLPESLEHAEEANLGSETTFFFAAIGIAVFFLLEKFLHWYHDHAGVGPEGTVTKTVVPLIIFGDGLHNFIDGALIAATTLTDPALGLITAIAVFLHEVPQEIGDFSVLVFGGLKMSQAIYYNLLSAATAYLGALAVFLVTEQVELFTLPLVALTAGAFLFIALGELVPEMVHKEKSAGKTALLALTFVLAIFLVRSLGRSLGLAH